MIWMRDIREHCGLNTNVSDLKHILGLFVYITYIPHSYQTASVYWYENDV